MPGILQWLLLVAVAAQRLHALSNGVGRTPAMGWNSWNFFRCNINETVIKEVADAIVASGLRDAGYKYVNIDDCWMHKRGPDGKIVPFQNKFPSGMKALGDYIHSKGLKFGVYSDAGNTTCEGYPGSWAYEKMDALTYAEWGVDYLKYDYCGMDKAGETVQQSYERMRDALAATGRPILFSMCSWGHGQPWLWGQNVGNSWRTSADVFAVWDTEQAKRLKLPSFLIPVLNAAQSVADLAKYAGPGGFNDPDMLVVGLDGMYPYGIVEVCPDHVVGCQPGQYISREKWGQVGGLTVTEQRSHFSLWVMLSAPLILGNDPRHMTHATLEILTAPEVLAISQDSLAQQAVKVSDAGGLQIWRKALSGGRVALMLLNLNSLPADITTVWATHVPELAAQWARNVTEPGPVCEDKEPKCKDWAAAGECERNPGFMIDTCKASCPKACPRPPGPPGPKATAWVRDAWARENLGAATGQFTAHLVEPHEARLLVITFIEPGAVPDAAQQTARSRLLSEGSSGSKKAPVEAVDSTNVAHLQAELKTAKQEVARLKDLVSALQAGSGTHQAAGKGASQQSSGAGLQQQQQQRHLQQRQHHEAGLGADVDMSGVEEGEEEEGFGAGTGAIWLRGSRGELLIALNVVFCVVVLVALCWGKGRKRKQVMGMRDD